MKKALQLCACGLAAVMLVAGCSKKTDDSEVASGSQAIAAELEMTGTVTLGKYKGVKVQVAPVTVTDEEVEERIQSALESNPDEKEVTDRAAKSGDVVNINYVGKKDGVAFENGSADNQDLELGSNSFIPGFEDGLIGAETGETKELNLTFPENYGNEELNGADVVFTVTVNSITELITPEFNDEFVQRISDFNTTEEYRDDVRASLLEQKEAETEAKKEADVLSDIVWNSTIEYAPELLEQETNKQVEMFTANVAQYGITLEDYAGVFGKDVEQFKNEIRNQCETMIEQVLVINEIAKQENFELTDADRNALSEEFGMSLSMLISQYGEEEVERAAMQLKVGRFVVENAVVTEVEPETEDAEEESEEKTEETLEEENAAAN